MTDPVNILIVDDRTENLVALEAILGALEHTLVRARSGEEALKALLSHEFALILLDVSMPGMDGFETATRIKRREKTRDIPIIFLTGLSTEPDHAFRGYAVGAVDYLAKPFDPWVLRTKVSVFVDLHLKNRLLAEQASLLRDGLAEQAGNQTGKQAWYQAGHAGDEPGTPAPAAGRGESLVAELSMRLAAVEEQVDELAGRPAGDGALDSTVAELGRRTARLRTAIDALGGTQGR
ncbi:MAG TPA: response regulator [Mycobacteriales bacterium]|nr:response regulator [Mycobacteriales bacterium]